ncbi:putative membrane protein [Saccharothrix tamanrassetensis]|uniref:Putative membrane protein n=1 Tax=Saccharothrix tamanrassetensis TaxID=1051531 RepID=A0A841CT98_9PSEU|nr:DUF2339 domain-containing protein [Saccharothrix tamanrassetensis]MBB5960519.1 putative membrane protein [Saccharothrix tamanrassetensis]
MTGQDPLIRLADELGHLGRRLEAVGLELRNVGTAVPTKDSAATVAARVAAARSAAAQAETAPAEAAPHASEQTGPTAQGASQQSASQQSAGQQGAGQQSASQQGATQQKGAGQQGAQRGPSTPAYGQQAAFAQPNPARPNPAQHPAQPNPAQPNPAQPNPAQPNPTQANPVRPNPAQPDAAWHGWHGPPPPQQAPWAAHPVTPQPQGPSLFDRLSQPGAGSKLLAWVGGAVTLLGVVLLLILAVQRGYLGPLPRVVGGAVLGAALVGIALRLHRSETSRTGAFAVAATGFAVLYLDVVAATSIYSYLPEGGGLAAGLVVAAAGLLLAMRWDSAAFAIGVVGACAVCAPILTEGFTPLLVAFLLVLKLAASPIHLKRDWPSLAVTAGVPPLLATILTIGRTDDPRVLSGVALLAAVVGVAAAVLTVRVRPGDVTALGLAVGSPMPALLTTVVLDKYWAAGLAGVIAVMMLALWAVGRRDLPTAFTAGVGGVGVFALFVSTAIVLEGSTRAAIVLAEALVLAFLARQLRSRGPLIGSVVFGAFGFVMTVEDAVPPRLLLQQPWRLVSDGALVAGLLTALVLGLLAIALPWAAVRLDVLGRHPLPWIGIGLVVLYAAAGVVLCGALLVSQSVTGFVFGHSIVTVSWTVAALVLLVRGIDVRSLRVAGLVLVGAAVAKLLLFDLARLDGIARVIAFIGAGLVLLTAGTRYAKLVATRRISAN